MNTAQLPFEHISIQHVSDVLASQGNLLSMMDLAGFFLCRQGWVEVSINEHTFRLQGGDIFFYTPSTFVSLLDRSADLDGTAVKCQMDFIIPLFERILDVQVFLAMREHPCIALTPEQLQTVERMVRLIHERQLQLQQQPASGNRHIILQHELLSMGESLFYELLLDYTIQSPAPTDYTPDSRDRIFQSFLISLFQFYKQEREVSFYAAQQCLSPRYFSTIIKERSGHSALQWIIQVVISSVRQVLRSTDLSIKEVATEFNFPSQSFFGKYFKQYTGLSPKEYRRNNS